jgi:sec-independent protein translocase protein TatB
MFEISWSELLILAVVTLIFVGPKDLPKFLNTMGRYAGMVRRQASEFRAQFEEAMREAELDALKKEVDKVRTDVEASVRDAQAERPKPPAAEAPPLQPMLPLGRTAGEVKAERAPADPAGGGTPAGAPEA